MDDAHDLARFLAAQEPVYPRVLRELEDGRKTTHWMWFVFPQLAGLGSSPMARRYAIISLAEAVAYLRQAVLGARLRQCVALVNRAEGRSIKAILGPPDDMKFHSCVTLFARASHDEPVFVAALDQYFGGEPDAATVDRLARPQIV